MIAIDTHTHSIASGHAYSSLEEMAQGARQRGLQGFALTDHSPGMPGGAHLYHFYNMRILPREIHGVLVFKGAEANIVDSRGTIDMDAEVLQQLEVVIASLHIPTYAPEDREAHTRALVEAARNPHVTVLGHPDDDRYPYDIPAVVRAAGEAGTLIEVNNTSLSPHSFRMGARGNYEKILAECRSQGVKVTLASDAHFSARVGETDHCEALLKELGFPRELVANATLEGFLEAAGL